MKKIPLISSVVLFALLCVSASYWVLQFIKPPVRKIIAPPPVVQVADVESVATLFGGALTVASNYQLKGIVLANPMKQSVAIIAVDGKATQAYPMDTEISNGVRLVEVHADYVLLLDNGVSKRVDLPQDAKSVSSGFQSPIAPMAPIVPTAAAVTNAVEDNAAVHGGNIRPRFNPQGKPSMPGMSATPNVMTLPSTTTPPNFPPGTASFTPSFVPLKPAATDQVNPTPNQQDR